MDSTLSRSTHYLFFGSLFRSVPSLSFPCDLGGHVDIDGLSTQARENYLFARTVVGCDYAVPVVMPALAAHQVGYGAVRRG
jgi:hypothetical protein